MSLDIKKSCSFHYKIYDNCFLIVKCIYFAVLNVHHFIVHFITIYF